MREQSLFITTPDGAKLHVTVWEADAGTYKEPARDVLLLHGWPNAGSVWRSLADALLLAENFRLVALDFRGYGRSDKTDAGYTCQQFARDAQAVAEQMGLQKYVLVGHSMGGKIAQVMVSAQPAGFSALVLVTPGLLTPAPPTPDMAARAAMFGDVNQIQSLVSGWAARPLRHDAADLIAEHAAQISRSAWDGWLLTMRGEDESANPVPANLPTLIVGGGKDTQRTAADLQELSQQIAGSQLVFLPGSGHLPHLEEPESLVALLVNFLDTSLPADVTRAT